MHPVGVVRRRLVGLSALVLILALVLFVLGLLPVPLYRHDPVAWEHPRLLDGGRTLQVTIIHGACDSGGGIDVRLRADTVEVRTYVKERRVPRGPIWTWSDAGCTTEGIFQDVSARLPEPLGPRPAYDPAYDHRELPVTG